MKIFFKQCFFVFCACKLGSITWNEGLPLIALLAATHWASLRVKLLVIDLVAHFHSEGL